MLNNNRHVVANFVAFKLKRAVQALACQEMVPRIKLRGIAAIDDIHARVTALSIGNVNTPSTIDLTATAMVVTASDASPLWKHNNHQKRDTA